MKSTNLRKLCELGLPSGQPVNVRYIRKLRPVMNPRGEIAFHEPTPAIAEVRVLLTAGEWFARYRDRRRRTQRHLRRLRRSHRSGRAIKRR